MTDKPGPSPSELAIDRLHELRAKRIKIEGKIMAILIDHDAQDPELALAKIKLALRDV